MLNRKKLAWIGAAAVIGAAFALVFAAGTAHSSTRPKPGAECRGQAGKVVTIETHDGPFKYRCEQRKGEDCPHWRIAPGQNPPHRGWPKRPALPCDCPPSPSKAASPAMPKPPAVRASPAPHT